MAQHVTWHHHAFSPWCTDELHGRFDAIEDNRTIRVLHMGNRRTVAYAGSRQEAVKRSRKPLLPSGSPDDEKTDIGESRSSVASSGSAATRCG